MHATRAHEQAPVCRRFERDGGDRATDGWRETRLRHTSSGSKSTDDERSNHDRFLHTGALGGSLSTAETAALRTHTTGPERRQHGQPA